MLSAAQKATFFLNFFGLTKVPLIFLTRPKIIEIGDERLVLKVSLRWLTKNHLNSMYFGALCIGADCAGGLMTMSLAQKEGLKLSFAFKDIQGEFLKRAEGDAYFTTDNGREVRDFIAKLKTSTERHNMTVPMVVTCPDKLGQEPVARFKLTLSAKRIT